MDDRKPNEIVPAPDMETTQQSAIRIVEETTTTEGDDHSKVIATIYAGAIPVVYMASETICAINHVQLVIHEHYLVLACVLGFLSILKRRKK